MRDAGDRNVHFTADVESIYLLSHTKLSMHLRDCINPFSQCNTLLKRFMMQGNIKYFETPWAKFILLTLDLSINVPSSSSFAAMVLVSQVPNLYLFLYKLKHILINLRRNLHLITGPLSYSSVSERVARTIVIIGNHDE